MIPVPALEDPGPPRRTGAAFTAVVLAGDRGPGDPLVRAAGVCCKALVPVAGRPMLLRVLEALGAASEVGPRLVCGPARLLAANAELAALRERGAIAWVDGRATPSTSASAALAAVPPDRPVLLTTADHALLMPAMVDQFCADARRRGCDAAVGLADAARVRAALPETRRTVLALRGGGYCGCNLFAFLTQRGREATPFWQRVEGLRKRPLALARALGWGLALRYASGRLTLEGALEALSRAAGMRLDAVLMDDPRAAVDVDKLEDWALVQRLAGSPQPPSGTQP
jgi:GTP:adenosylcobinamide-phosphate guanylyltransferase